MRVGKLLKVGHNCLAWPVEKYDLRGTEKIVLNEINPIILKNKTLIMILSVIPSEDIEVSWLGNDPLWFDRPWLVLTEDQRLCFVKSSGTVYTDITPFTNEKGDVIKYFDEEMNLVEVVP